MFVKSCSSMDVLAHLSRPGQISRSQVKAMPHQSTHIAAAFATQDLPHKAHDFMYHTPCPGTQAESPVLCAKARAGCAKGLLRDEELRLSCKRPLAWVA